MQLTTLLTLLPLLAAPALSAPALQHHQPGQCSFRSSTAPVSSPDTDAALAQTPASVLGNMGPYSPFLSQQSEISRNVPDGWKVDQIQIISRHGARNPTANALKKIRQHIANLKPTKTITDPALAFLANWTFPEVQADALTDFGRREVWYAGKRYAEQYSQLGGDAFVRADQSARVVESASFFLQGFNGEAFDVAATLTPPHVVQTGNMTLDIEGCEVYEQQKPDPAEVAETNWANMFGPPIVARLNNALGTNLTVADETVTALMSLCSFDSLNGQDWVASPWCSAFTDDEWKQNEYWYDLSKFYGKAWGTPYGRVLGAGLANEIIARLTGNPVVLGSGTDSGLDTSDDTFPLDKSVYVDFSHDNNIAHLLPALGLSWETPLPTTPDVNAIPEHRFVVSKNVPFAGRYVFERLVDGEGKHYVRLLINDAVQRLDYAGCGVNGVTKGICDLDAFVAAQSYVQAVPSVWDQVCYAPLINTTIVL